MQPASDIIIALRNIMERNSTILAPLFRSDGKANAAGDSLEYFVKDMFSPGNKAAQHSDEDAKKRVYAEYLSWDGDNKHFPDFIIKGGVGVEPKKVQTTTYSNISLNSSYPKKFILPSTQNVPPAKLIQEQGWGQKDIVYAVGSLPKGSRTGNKLRYLWMFYSNTYIADPSNYENLISGVRSALAGLPGEMKSDSKELGRMVGIDKLGVSNLRVRGMYEMKHPAKIFETALRDLDFIIPEDSTGIYVAIRKSDYESLGRIVNLEDSNHNLSDYFESGKLMRIEVNLPDPDGEGEIGVYLFVGYTD